MSTTAHCRSCDAWAPRAEMTERKTDRYGDAYDHCKHCGSIDVDIMSPAGVNHEMYELHGDRS